MKSQMVSMPTSGMQVENAREIFKCIFDALGLMSSEQRPYFSEDSFSCNCQLDGLTVHIVCSEESNHDDDSQIKTMFVKGSTALMVKNLKVSGHGTKSDGLRKTVPYPLNLEPSRIIPWESKLDISFGDVTQIVNIALIRLLMQITETIDFVKEENKFAQKVKSLEAVTFPSARKGSSNEKCLIKDEMHQGWSVMFNVLQLYADDNMSLKRGPNDGDAEIRTLPVALCYNFFLIF